MFVLPLLTQRPLLGQDSLETAAWPAGVVAQDTLPTERAYIYNFSEVDVDKLESWLKWLGYELPAKLSGNVSGWLWAQRSPKGWFDAAGYRMEGEVVSPQLFIESWKLEQARLRFGYANGVWYVGRLSGLIAEKSSDKSIGQADLIARMPLAAPRTFSFSGGVAQVQLQPLLDAFELDVTINNRPGELVLSGQVPLRSIDDISSWRVDGELDIAAIEFTGAADVPLLDIVSPLRLGAGRWRIVGAQVVVAEQALRVDAQGEIAQGESSTLRDAQLPYSATFSTEQVDLRKLLAAFRKLPMDQQAVQGIASLSGEVSGSVAQGLGLAQATIRSPQLMLAGETLSDVELLAMLHIKDETPLGLSIDLKSARLAGGAVRGQLTWPQLARIGQAGLPSHADLNIENLDLSRLQSNAIPVALSGTADGQLRLRTESPQPPLDWSGELRLRIRQFAVAGNAVGDVYLSGSKTDAEPQLRLQLRDAQSTFSLQATGELEQPAEESRLAVQLSSYSLTGELHDFQTRLALAGPLGPQFASIPIAASGEFKFDAKIENVLDKPTNYGPTSGSVSLDKLSLALPEHTFYLKDSLLNIRPDAFRLERFRWVSMSVPNQTQNQSVGLGRVVGSALIRRNAQGEHLLNLLVSDLDIAPYIAAFAPQEFHGLAGQMQAETRLRKSANTPSWTTSWTGQLAGQFQDVTFRAVPLSELEFRGSLRPELLSFQLNGGFLGGELDAKLALPPQLLETLIDGSGGMQTVAAAPHNANDFNLEIDATLQAIKLQRLMMLFFGPRLGAKYAGVADLQLNATSGPSGMPTVEATVEIPNFSFERRSLAQRLVGVAHYQDGNLLINQFSGGIAGGRIDVVGKLQTGEAGNLYGDLRFGAENMQLPAMAAWVTPNDADNFEGRFSYTGRALIGDEIALNGAVRLRDAVVMDLPIQELRSQLRILFSRLGRLHVLSARNVHGTALGGMVDGEADLHGDARYELSSTIQIGNGKTDQLSRALGFEHIVGTGTFDAQMNLKSSDGLQLSALTGPIQIDIRNGDAQSVPILSDLGRLLPVFQLGSTDIRSGRLNAQFGQGQLYIAGVILSSEAFSFIGDGRVSLTSGGLDINALVSTGDNFQRQFAQGVSQKLVIAALPQLALLAALNDSILNRTVYLHIGGSPSHPIIQPQVAQTLARAFLQNVARRLLIVAPATAASQKD